MRLQWKRVLVAGALACVPFLVLPRAFAQQETTAMLVDALNGVIAPESLPDAPDAASRQDSPGSQSTAAQPPQNSTAVPADTRNEQGQPATSTSLGPNAAAQKIPPSPYQTKRILGIVPNFRAVSADVKLPAQTAGAKYKTALEDTFDYSGFIFVGIQAGIAQATDSYPIFHHGVAGYGRYYWHTFADTLDENLWVESILPSALHQDSRYYTLGHGGFVKRAAYSFSRTLITRTDEGGETFNSSEVVGAGAAAGIAYFYYPEQYRTWTKTGQRWLTSVIIDGGTFVAKEFWPDINSAVFHQKQ